MSFFIDFDDVADCFDVPESQLPPEKRDLKLRWKAQERRLGHIFGPGDLLPDPPYVWGPTPDDSDGDDCYTWRERAADRDKADDSQVVYDESQVVYMSHDAVLVHGGDGDDDWIPF